MGLGLGCVCKYILLVGLGRGGRMDEMGKGSKNGNTVLRLQIDLEFLVVITSLTSFSLSYWQHHICIRKRTAARNISYLFTIHKA